MKSHLNSTNFTGITVCNSEGGFSNLSRAGIAFKAYDWVQSAIWHGRNMTDGNEGALVLGTNPNTSDLTVGGVVGRMYIINNGNVGIGTKSPNAKLEVNGNIAVNPGQKIQLSGSADITHHFYHSTADDFDIVNYSTGFKFQHFSSGSYWCYIYAKSKFNVTK